MREVTQSRTGFPTGNCIEASVASILELDPADPRAKTWPEDSFREAVRLMAGSS